MFKLQSQSAICFLSKKKNHNKTQQNKSNQNTTQKSMHLFLTTWPTGKGLMQKRKLHV